MALTFPLSAAVFADKLKIRSVEWKLQRYDEMSGLGTGEILSAQLAPPRWMAKVSMTNLTYAEASQVQALVEALDPMASFFLYATQQPYPQYDPTGSILGASSVTIQTVGGNNRSLTLAGLPAAYRLTVGDMIAWSYGSNPVRRALHRVMETVTANGAGVTPVFEVRPHLRPGTTTGLSVSLVRPTAKMLIVPDSFNPGNAEDLFTRGMAFEAIQRP